MNPSDSNKNNQQLEGQAFTPERSTVADRLVVPLTMVFGVSLQKASAKGTFSEEKIGQIVAQESVLCRLPDQLLRTVQRSVSDIRGAVAQVDDETEELWYRKIIVPPRMVYYVFHNGSYHFYHNELPQEVCELRQTALFWINYSANECFSRGKKREKLELGARALSMLYVLCDKRNAGRIISFPELYLQVCEVQCLPDIAQIINNINVVQCAINTFAEEPFISLKSKKDNAKVRRIHGQYELEIAKDTPKECCIIKKFPDQNSSIT